MKIKQNIIVKSAVVFALVVYFLFLTYKSVSFNYQTNRKIAALHNEISVLEMEREYLENLNVYYGTTTYKELEARRKLGMKKNGEAVIKIPVDSEKLAQAEKKEITSKEIQGVQSQQNQNGDSNARKWFKFVFRI